MRLITHFLVFAIGAALGIYWGVNHPDWANREHDLIQQKAAEMQQDWLSKHGSTPSSPTTQPSGN